MPINIPADLPARSALEQERIFVMTEDQARAQDIRPLRIAIVNLIANLLFKAHVSWALFPLGIFSFGWALMVPVVTLLVLDLHPDRRGMASSLQMFVGSTANGIVAGVISPLVMHSTVGLATASLLMLSLGLVAWTYIRHRWPAIGHTIAHG